MFLINSKKIFLLFLCFLAWVVALRGDTRDTSNYVDMYVNLHSFPWSPGAFFETYYMEWGIGVLASLANSLGLPVEIFFFIISLLTFAALAKASVEFGLSGWAPKFDTKSRKALIGRGHPSKRSTTKDSVVDLRRVFSL